MVSDKTTRYANRNISPVKLSEWIIEYLKQDGYETQKAEGYLEFIIQARKESILQDLTMVDRCLTILILGQPDDFTIRIGIGRWFQGNLEKGTVASIMNLVFVKVDIPAAIWNENFENIIKNIDSIIEGRWRIQKGDNFLVT